MYCITEHLRTLKQNTQEKHEMLAQLTKILQDRYPRLDIDYSVVFGCIFIYHTDGYRLILEIHEEGIKHKNGITYLTPTDPSYFPEINKLIENDNKWLHAYRLLSR